MGRPLIRIEGLRKAYRRGAQEILVLDDISFDIDQGEFLALVGPSGSGKSTLLNLIAGIDAPDAGRILVGDADIATFSENELAAWRSAHVGFIFQFYNLIPVLSALENVELPLILTGLSRAERRAHAEAALAAVNMADRMDHRPAQLSGGQQQRAAIARAIVADPDILVADEPTGDLDRASAEDVLRLMNRLNEEMGKTIVMVTHDQRAAEAAHRVRRLDKGVLDVSDQARL